MNLSASESSRSVNQKEHVIRASTGKTLGPALKGASIAFQLPPSPAQSLANTYSGRNGALVAAARAGTGYNKGTVNVDTAKGPVAASAGVGDDSKTSTIPRNVSRSTSESTDSLKPPSSSHSSRQQSPSHIAATLAAARSTPAPVNTAQSKAKGPSHIPPQPAIPPDQKDETSIPATNALVQMFEARYGSAEVWSKSRSIDSSRQIASPIPVRPPMPLRFSSHTAKKTSNIPKDAVKEMDHFSSKAGRQPFVGVAAVSSRPSNSDAARQFLPRENKNNPPTLPPIRRNGRHSVPTTGAPLGKAESSDTSSDDTTASSSYTSARDHLSRTNTLEVSSPRKPVQPPPQPLKLPPKPKSPSGPSPTPATITPSPGPQFPKRPSSRSTTITYPTTLTPQLTASSLANAMVASTLASTRAPSPSKPPLIHRHSKPRHPPFHASRTPSPGRPGFRHTLRAPHDKDSDSDTNRRKYHAHRGFKKAPNKHHEGNRKRWRDSITERERKRYEGVWAANKGILLPPAPPQTTTTTTTKARSSTSLTSPPNLQDCVHALAVKDLWTRSQLSSLLLEEIWELVSSARRPRGGGVDEEPREAKAYLTREEFLVGMWLVDQCLKGRKLPAVVGQSVWGSVRLLGGVRVWEGRERGRIKK